jgi:hypothetical protein
LQIEFANACVCKCLELANRPAKEFCLLKYDRIRTIGELPVTLY